jgi:cobalt-zinc-cadmium efflux system protein
MTEVEGRMRAIAGVTAVHDLHVWTVASGMVAMSGHAMVPDLAQHPGVLTEIRDALAGLGISHVTVQLESRDECVEDGAAMSVATPARGGCGHTH